MAAFTKRLLSGSTNGRPIKVVATGTPGTVIHTAVAGTDLDEIWIYAVNTSNTSRILTLEFGGATSPDDLINVSLSRDAGLILVAPGSLLNNGLLVRAFASAANVINIMGWVNRII